MPATATKALRHTFNDSPCSPCGDAGGCHQADRFQRGRQFLHEVGNELLRAMDTHGPMHSLHEAYAVILEELDELWDECRKKREDRDPAAIRTELLQIAAMAARAAVDLGLAAN